MQRILAFLTLSPLEAHLYPQKMMAGFGVWGMGVGENG
jgi:hypothetical protein